MTNRAAAVFSICTAFCATLASAQPVTNSHGATAQVQVKITDGAYSGCGVRVVVMPGALVYPARVVDYSLNLYLDARQGPWAVVKFTAMEVASEAALQRQQFKELYVVEGWLKPEESALPPASSAQVRGDPPTGLLTSVAATSLLKFILSLIEAPQRALVGIRAKGDALVRVTSHTIALEDGDRRTLNACVKGMVESIRSSSKAQAKPGR